MNTITIKVEWVAPEGLFTHLGVAITVASGTADVGLGIESAAMALGLDFIPIGEERYDLAIPTEYLEYPLMQMMLGIIRSEAFKTEVLAGNNIAGSSK